MIGTFQSAFCQSKVCGSIVSKISIVVCFVDVVNKYLYGAGSCRLRLSGVKLVNQLSRVSR